MRAILERKRVYEVSRKGVQEGIYRKCKKPLKFACFLTHTPGSRNLSTEERMPEKTRNFPGFLTLKTQIRRNRRKQRQEHKPHFLCKAFKWPCKPRLGLGRVFYRQRYKRGSEGQKKPLYVKLGRLCVCVCVCMCGCGCIQVCERYKKLPEAR